MNKEFIGPTMIFLKSVAFCKRQITNLDPSSREISQTVLFVSTESTSSHYLLSQFGLASFCIREKRGMWYDNTGNAKIKGGS